MKEAFFNKKFLEHNNEIYGIDLGYDHCAEHEWGISKLAKAFGLTSKKAFGVDRRKIHVVPESLTLKESAVLELCYSYNGYHPTCCSTKNNISSAWSESSFYVASSNKFIKELYKAFQDLDVLIGVGMNTNPFANSGLVICIASKYPFKKELYDIDYEDYLLHKEAEDTGIYKKLEAAGKKFYSLSPKKDEDGLKFWLNPRDQDKYNYGWFTLKDLLDWAEDKGKVMIN